MLYIAYCHNIYILWYDMVVTVTCAKSNEKLIHWRMTLLSLIEGKFLKSALGRACRFKGY